MEDSARCVFLFVCLVHDREHVAMLARLSTHLLTNLHNTNQQKQNTNTGPRRTSAPWRICSRPAPPASPTPATASGASMGPGCAAAPLVRWFKLHLESHLIYISPTLRLSASPEPYTYTPTLHHPPKITHRHAPPRPSLPPSDPRGPARPRPPSPKHTRVVPRIHLPGPRDRRAQAQDHRDPPLRAQRLPARRRPQRRGPPRRDPRPRDPDAQRALHPAGLRHRAGAAAPAVTGAAAAAAPASRPEPESAERRGLRRPPRGGHGAPSHRSPQPHLPPF